MLIPEYTNQFKKDIKLVKKRNWDLEDLKELIRKRCDEESLPANNREHSLSGNWQGCYECHIRPDWLLIYQKNNNRIVFDRTGSHSDLF